MNSSQQLQVAGRYSLYSAYIKAVNLLVCLILNFGARHHIQRERDAFAQIIAFGFRLRPLNLTHFEGKIRSLIIPMFTGSLPYSEACRFCILLYVFRVTPHG
jgi:hypothetical protein